MKLLDKDKLINYVKCERDPEFHAYMESLSAKERRMQMAMFLREIETAPSEFVVRCKDCCYREKMPSGNLRCEQTLTMVEPEGFCSWGFSSPVDD